MPPHGRPVLPPPRAPACGHLPDPNLRPSAVGSPSCRPAAHPSPPRA